MMMKGTIRGLLVVAAFTAAPAYAERPRVLRTGAAACGNVMESRGKSASSSMRYVDNSQDCVKVRAQARQARHDRIVRLRVARLVRQARAAALAAQPSTRAVNDPVAASANRAP